MTAYQVRWGYSNGGQLFTTRNRAKMWADEIKRPGEQYNLVEVEIESPHDCFDVWNPVIRKIMEGVDAVVECPCLHCMLRRKLTLMRESGTRDDLLAFCEQMIAMIADRENDAAMLRACGIEVSQ